MSSASILKLFCRIYLALKCSFDEFVGEKVVSPSYSSAILRQPPNWCFQTVMFEKTLESPLGCTEIKSINPKGNQPWIVIGRTDDEVPILWTQKANSLEKTLILGKIDGKRRRRWQKMKWLNRTTNSIVMSLSKHWEIVKDGEAWCAAVHDAKELDTTEQLNKCSDIWENCFMYISVKVFLDASII